MQRGLVSIMMPAYNAEHYIQSAIQSVIDQSYTNWELLVVNDGSSDKTAEIAAQFKDNRIRLFNKENGGESSARNVALENSKGEFIAYLDADDLYLPDHLSLTLAFLRDNPNRDAVYTDGFHIDEDGRRMASLQSRRRGPFEGRLFEQTVLASNVFGPPACVVLRRDLVTQHKLRYDERIVIGPDWDFFIRYADVANFGYIPTCSCLYRVHRSNITAQVNPKRRSAYLTMCRENAIRLENFKTCSAETQAAVFYDLLINLLNDQPDSQAEVSSGREFAELPKAQQARLLRLMASQAIRTGNHHTGVSVWLNRARRLHPEDYRAAILARIFRFSPQLCSALLRAGRSDRRPSSPFADLTGSAAHT